MADQPWIAEISALLGRAWTTRDACATHYPRYCPLGCVNAGQHDEELRQIGFCECHQCRAGHWRWPRVIEGERP